MKSSLFILFILGLNFGKIQAQNTITLENAIVLANQNNLNLKQSRLESTYSEALIKTHKDIPKAGINTELGQYNSSYFDTKIAFNQTLALPIVYKAQKNVLVEDFRAKQINETAQKYDLDKAITTVFNDFYYLKSKEKLVLKTDDFYAQLLNNATLRFEKGETNLLEKTLISSQKATISQENKQIQQAISLKMMELQYLLNSTTVFIPSLENFDLKLNPSAFENHPEMWVLLQEKNVAAAQTNLEKTKLLPELNFGYNNLSMRGLGVGDKFFKSYNRFQSVQLGVNVFLNTKNQKQKIEVAKLNENIIESNVQLTKSKLENRYKLLAAKYQNEVENIVYFEKEGLLAAKIIFETAQKQFLSGEINSSDFESFFRQAIDIENNYLEAKKNLNETILAINYL